MHASSEPTNAQKSRRGLSRLWHAGRYSMAGLRAGWGEQAFFQAPMLDAPGADEEVEVRRTAGGRCCADVG